MNKSFFSQISFYVEDDESIKVDFKGEKSTFTLQLKEV